MKRNFAHYRNTLRNAPPVSFQQAEFKNGKHILTLHWTERQNFPDIFHAFCGFFVERDKLDFEKGGMDPKTATEMAWDYLQEYVRKFEHDFHRFRPVKVRHFHRQLDAFTNPFFPDGGSRIPFHYTRQYEAHPLPDHFELPAEGLIEYVLALEEHRLQAQYLLRTTSHFLLLSHEIQQ